MSSRRASDETKPDSEPKGASKAQELSDEQLAAITGGMASRGGGHSTGRKDRMADPMARAAADRDRV